MTGEAGFLPADRFREIQESVPILCLDLLPVRRGGGGGIDECLLIERLDRSGERGWNLVGGRVRLHETLVDCAARHLAETLGPAFESRLPDPARPDLVAEYPRGDGPDGMFDPAQHAVALTYVVGGEGPLTPGGEAISARWFAGGDLPAPDDFGFGQGAVVARLLSREPARERS